MKIIQVNKRKPAQRHARRALRQHGDDEIDSRR